MPLRLQSRSRRAACILGGLLCTTLATAAPTTLISTSLRGSFNGPQENGCLWVSAFRFRADCNYSAEPKPPNAGSMPWRWIGPTHGAVYYPPASHQRDPGVPIGPPGDERRTPTLAAELTLDTQGTDSPDDDRISGRLVVGASLRKLVTRVGPAQGAPPKVVVESWSHIVHTLAPTPVTSVTSLPGSRSVYVIAAHGFPKRLCQRLIPADCFPSPHAHPTVDGATAAGFWAEPGQVPITRAAILGANAGAKTSMEISDYQCHDTADGTQCRTSPLLWGVHQPAGFDNLLLRVVVRSDGTIESATGYWTVEYHLAGGPARLATGADEPNSWFGGYLVLKRAGFNGELLGATAAVTPKKVTR